LPVCAALPISKINKKDKENHVNDIFGCNLAELKEALADYKVPAYRARQIAEWMYQKGARSFDDMTNLPKNLRAALSGAFSIREPRVKDRLDSADGQTTKFLLEFADGTAVETVLMRHSTASVFRRRPAAIWAVHSVRQHCTVWRGI